MGLCCRLRPRCCKAVCPQRSCGLPSFMELCGTMCPLQAAELMFKLAGRQLAGGNHPGLGAKAVPGPLGYLPFRQGGFPALRVEQLGRGISGPPGTCSASMGMASPSHRSTPSAPLSMAASLCCTVPHASTETLCANGKVPAKSWLAPKCNSHKKCLSVALTNTVAHRGTAKVPTQGSRPGIEPSSHPLNCFGSK